VAYKFRLIAEVKYGHFGDYLKDPGQKHVWAAVVALVSCAGVSPISYPRLRVTWAALFDSPPAKRKVKSLGSSSRNRGRANG
jgi:hypothetical protein